MENLMFTNIDSSRKESYSENFILSPKDVTLVLRNSDFVLENLQYNYSQEHFMTHHIYNNYMIVEQRYTLKDALGDNRIQNILKIFKIFQPLTKESLKDSIDNLKSHLREQIPEPEVVELLKNSIDEVYEKYHTNSLEEKKFNKLSEVQDKIAQILTSKNLLNDNDYFIVTDFVKNRVRMTVGLGQHWILEIYCDYKNLEFRNSISYKVDSGIRLEVSLKR